MTIPYVMMMVTVFLFQNWWVLSQLEVLRRRMEEREAHAERINARLSKILVKLHALTKGKGAI